MSKILFDTSVIIDFLRRKDKRNSLLYFLAAHKYQLAVSIITHTELYAGKSVWENKTARKELAELFSGMQIFPLTEEISEKAGEIRARQSTNLLDAIVAATASMHKLELSTLNRKDFEHIKKLELFSGDSPLS